MLKYINDHYGHVEGDHAIKRAADALYKEKAART
ncbi:MAG: diguanylate cyclase [Clostridiales bacterium]|nr:diguanylate cyclase [Clostridiales bacterium]